jgi:predicted AlkP superfamily pyrophosphatase or phosphodiesterase
MTKIQRRGLSARGRLTLPVLLAFAAPALTGAAALPAAPVPAVASADSASRGTTKHGRVADHVLVISIDGLRPDAIERFNAFTILRLMREGSYALTAQTILPSKTLPSHTSMLTGVDADQHGITWNDERVDDHGHVDVPTVFGLAKAEGFRTAAFFSKTKFHHLEAPNTIDYVRSPKGGVFDFRWDATRTVNEVGKHLRSRAAAPNLMFVHIGEPDYAGHMFGWMGRAYGNAVRAADQAVAQLLEKAEDRFGRGNFTVILTADHGGHDRTHGSEDPRDTTIPWIVWGKGVAAGVELPTGIRTMDTAATALWMLGVDAPPAWVGTARSNAFVDSATVDAPTALSDAATN